MTLSDHAESSVSHHDLLGALRASPDSTRVLAALRRTITAATEATKSLVLRRSARGYEIAGETATEAILLNDGPPIQAMDAGTIIVDRGPARPAGRWGQFCATHGIGTAVVLPLTVLETHWVIVVVDPSDADAAVSILESLAPDIAIVFDVAVRVGGAATLVDKLKELEESVALGSDLIAMVSHELRTPLTSILGTLQTLTRPEFAPSDPKAVTLIERALIQTDRLRDLVDDLLVASRIDRKVLQIRARLTDVEDLVMETVRAVPGASEVVAVMSAAGVGRIMTDSDHLTRIVRNLIENALLHAAGSPIEIVLEGRGGGVVISVVDHGGGVAPEEESRLFQRTPPPNGKSGGLGLGLAIAKGLADAIGAQVCHHPTPGGGATFEVRVPASAG